MDAELSIFTQERRRPPPAHPSNIVDLRQKHANISLVALCAIILCDPMVPTTQLHILPEVGSIGLSLHLSSWFYSLTLHIVQLVHSFVIIFLL
ncbi:hypothetical protein BDR03DRAFT_941953 [Suillus americanus]|nr:hypothetical protein BDR03DRAFT_941953 [Suillus americanus]